MVPVANALLQLLLLTAAAALAGAAHLQPPPDRLTPPVRTSNGRAQGKVFEFGALGQVGAFLGLPYARAPVGKLRFQKPQPARSWRGNRRFTQFGPACYFISKNRQPHMAPIRFSEDCLSLNVFTPLTPELTPQSDLPIMVYIHGGAYVVGSSAAVGDEGIARHLCTKGVVVVTLNYRVGVFGFLATGDAHAPGNQALWDMRLALRWVRENARAFGGDPANLLVFGQSAGGSATHALLMSPATAGLFAKAAPMSGVTGRNGVAPAALMRDQALRLARALNFTPAAGASRARTNADLVAFMQTVPPDLLAMDAAYNVNFDFADNGRLKMLPVLGDDFLPGTLEQRHRAMHDVPIMTGNTAYEALAFLPAKGMYNTAINMVSYYTDGDSTLAKEAMDLFVDRSLPPDSEKFLKQCVLVVSDVIFNKDIYRLAAQAQERESPIYLYTFEYFKSTNATKNYAFQGATHCSDLQYLFGLNENEVYEPTPDDDAVSEELSNFFVNFAKYSDPNGRETRRLWEPVDRKSSRPAYLAIDRNASVLRPEFMDGRMDKWEAVDRSVASARSLSAVSTMLVSMFSWSNAQSLH